MEEFWDDPDEDETDEPSEATALPGRIPAAGNVLRLATILPPAVATGVEAVAEPAPRETVSLEPRLIPIRDKRYAFGRATSFAEFATQALHHGALLRQRFAETRLAPGQQAQMCAYPDIIYVLAVVTEEDPDTVAVLPVIARLLDGAPRFELRILRDEEAVTPLSLLLPDMNVAEALEEWDLPQFLCFDEEWELEAQWGPRPAAVEERLEAWLARRPEYEALAEDDSAEAQERYAELVEELIYEMRVWYNSGAARACLEEWRELLQGMLATDEPAA